MLFEKLSMRFAITAVVAAIGLSPFSPAATITSGVYTLANHPDGAEAPPYYGLRLDELYNATPAHDVFSFDFEHPQSSVVLVYNSVAQTIRIFGNAYGGRDVGGSYANDAYLGVYHFDFLYNQGVGLVPGDDDIWSNTANHANSGYIQTPLSDTIGLVDEWMDYSFRFGDENNDAGHRGFAGISGWGWLSYGFAPPYQHVEFSDWLFTATLIPEPSTAALAAIAALAILRRRR